MARGRWYYAHLPTAYEWAGKEAGFLPILTEQYPVAGVNGVREILAPDGRPIGIDDNGLRAGLTRKGAIILDPHDHRLGPWRNYVRMYPCVGGGKCYVFSTDKGGVTFTLLPNGSAIPQDAAELLREFRAWLLAEGIIPPMPKPVYDMLMEVEYRGLNRLIRQASSNPHMSEQVEQKQERIRLMEAAWAALSYIQSPESAAPESAAPAASTASPARPRRLTAPVVE
jgi:hypothetical protein